METSKKHKNLRCFMKSLIYSVIVMNPIYYLLYKLGYWEDFKN